MPIVDRNRDRGIKQVSVMRYGMRVADVDEVVDVDGMPHRVVRRNIHQPTARDLAVWPDMWPGDYIAELGLQPVL